MVLVLRHSNENHSNGRCHGFVLAVGTSVFLVVAVVRSSCCSEVKIRMYGLSTGKPTKVADVGRAISEGLSSYRCKCFSFNTVTPFQLADRGK